MTDAWFDLQKNICEAMTEHVKPMILSLSKIISHDYGEAWGTGTFLELFGKPYVLTNDHVAEQMTKGGLAFTPNENEHCHRLVHPFVGMGPPVDAAISRVDDISWDGKERSAVPVRRIALSHRTAEHEFQFMMGFPGRGYWSQSGMTLVSRGVPYLTQEVPLPEGLDNPEFYFALPYNPEMTKSVDGKPARMPLPGGFSGSLVWNTRAVEVGISNWNPGMAVATGLIWGWGQNEDADKILAVKIEVVRALILRALREECAYFHWVRRGSPDGDALTDWTAAESEIRDLR
jgi:hypothetical protein